MLALETSFLASTAVAEDDECSRAQSKLRCDALFQESCIWMQQTGKCLTKVPIEPMPDLEVAFVASRIPKVHSVYGVDGATAALAGGGGGGGDDDEIRGGEILAVKVLDAQGMIDLHSQEVISCTLTWPMYRRHADKKQRRSLNDQQRFGRAGSFDLNHAASTIGHGLKRILSQFGTSWNIEDAEQYEGVVRKIATESVKSLAKYQTMRRVMKRPLRIISMTHQRTIYRVLFAPSLLRIASSIANKDVVRAAVGRQYRYDVMYVSNFAHGLVSSIVWHADMPKEFHQDLLGKVSLSFMNSLNTLFADLKKSEYKSSIRDSSIDMVRTVLGRALSDIPTVRRRLKLLRSITRGIARGLGRFSALHSKAFMHQLGRSAMRGALECVMLNPSSAGDVPTSNEILRSVRIIGRQLVQGLARTSYISAPVKTLRHQATAVRLIPRSAISVHAAGDKISLAPQRTARQFTGRSRRSRLLQRVTRVGTNAREPFLEIEEAEKPDIQCKAFSKQ